MEYKITLLLLLSIYNYNALGNYIEDSILTKEIVNDAKWKTYCALIDDTIYVKNDKKYNYSKPYYIIGELNLVLCSMSCSIDNVYYENIKADYAVKFCPQIENDSLSAKDLILERNWYNRFIIPYIYYSKSYPYKPIVFKFDYGTHTLDPNSPYGEECKVHKIKEIIINPLCPEVIYKIRKYSPILNPWFLNEAKKRGVFDTVKFNPEWVESELLLNEQKPKNCREETIRTR